MPTARRAEKTVFIFLRFLFLIPFAVNAEVKEVKVC